MSEDMRPPVPQEAIEHDQETGEIRQPLKRLGGWYRMYHEQIHDNREISDGAFRTWMNLCAHVGEREAKAYEKSLGAVPSPDRWVTFSPVPIKPRVAISHFSELLKVGILTSDENGDWFLSDWFDRQTRPSSAALRKQKQRAKAEKDNPQT